MTQNKQEQDAFLQYLDGEKEYVNERLPLAAGNPAPYQALSYYFERLYTIRAKYLEIKALEEFIPSQLQGAEEKESDTFRAWLNKEIDNDEKDKSENRPLYDYGVLLRAVRRRYNSLNGLINSKLNIADFSELSAERAENGFKTYRNVPITYWTTALAGEVGELCNMIKKIERVKNGGIDGGSSYTAASLSKDNLAEEIGGIFIYLNLLSRLLDVDMEEAIIDTFNSKSDKYGFPQKYPQSPSPSLDRGREKGAAEKERDETRDIVEEVIRIGRLDGSFKLYKRALEYFEKYPKQPQ